MKRLQRFRVIIDFNVAAGINGDREPLEIGEVWSAIATGINSAEVFDDYSIKKMWVFKGHRGAAKRERRKTKKKVDKSKKALSLETDDKPQDCNQSDCPKCFKNLP
jgi:hypothetical protein